MDREKAERYLKIGLFGAMLTLIGDCLIGAAKFPDGANMIEGYYAIALKYLLYFLMPAAAVFGVFFIGASAVQFIAFISGRTPFPKWYCVFNLLLAKAVFNSVRQLGNNALTNGIGTSNMSLGAIVMFTALLLGWKKYVGEREIIGGSNAFFRGRQQAGTDHIR